MVIPGIKGSGLEDLYALPPATHMAGGGGRE